MTPLLLVKAVIKFLTPILNDITIKVDEGEVTPRIHEGWVPPKTKSNRDEEYPHVAVRLKNGTDTKNESTVNIIIYFGSYSYGTLKDDKLVEDYSGYKDIANMIERVRQELLKTSFLGPYILEDNVTWEIPEEQPYPYWTGNIRTTWKIRQIQKDIDI